MADCDVPALRAAHGRGLKSPASPWVSALRTIALAGLIFFILLGISLERPDAFQVYPGTDFKIGLGLTSTTGDIAAALPDADPGFYAAGGIDIFQHGWISHDNEWMLNCWAPGMFVLHAALLRIFGPQAPAILLMVILNCCLWSLALSALFKAACFYVPPAVALCGVTLFLSLGMVRFFFLGFGVVFSETYALSTWALGLSLLLLARQGQRKLLAVTAGVSLVLSAYIRTTFMLAMSATTAVVAGWIVLCVVFGVIKRRSPVEPLRSCSYLIICLAVFHALTLPYRFYGLERTGHFDWTDARYVWGNSWMTDAYLDSKKLDLLKRGGDNTACHVDYTKCLEIAAAEAASPVPYSGAGSYSFADFQYLAERTFLRHPLHWLVYKGGLLPDYWFTAPSASVQIPNGPQEYLQNSFYIGCFTFCLFGFFYFGQAELSALFVGLIGSYAATYVFMHFEVRYLFPFKLGVTIFAALYAARLAAGRCRTTPWS